MEKQRRFLKKILALFMLVIILGGTSEGIFSNVSFGATIINPTNLNKTYTITNEKVFATHNFGYIRYGAKITLISGPKGGWYLNPQYDPSAPAGATSLCVCFTEAGTYKFAIDYNATPNSPAATTVIATIKIIQKIETKPKYDTKTINMTLKNGKATETLILDTCIPDWTMGTFTSRVTGITAEAKSSRSILITATKTGTYKYKIRNNNSGSKYYDSTIIYNIVVKKASSSNKKEQNDSTPTTQIIIQQPTYYPSITIGEATIENSDKYTQSKQVKFGVSTADISYISSVKVNGKSSGKTNCTGSNESYTFTAKKNETFVVTVTAIGKDGKTYTKTKNIKVTKIDNTKPTVSNFNEVKKAGTNKVKLKVTIKDNSKLSYVEVYNPNDKKIQTIQLSGTTKTITTEEVSIQGKYKFVIYDEAGNKYSYKTSKVKIDTEGPVIKSFSVTKVDSKKGNTSTEDKGVSKIIANTGNKIILRIYTNEKVVGNPTIKIGGKTVEELDGTIEVKSKASTNGYYLTKVTFKISDKLSSGYIPITISNIKDNWGNVNKTEKTYSKKLYYDVTAPIIKQVDFSSTTAAGLNLSSETMEINAENTIYISFTTHEMLVSNPVVTLMGKSTTIPAVSSIKTDKGYQYTAEFKFSEVEIYELREKIKSSYSGSEPQVQEVLISNCIDRANNTMEEQTYIYDSNSKILMISTGENADLLSGGFFMDIIDEENAEEDNTKYELGDTNQNGYITSYDYLYYYSDDSMGLTDKEEIERFDINQDGVKNSVDTRLIKDIVNNKKTVINKDTIEVKIYKGINVNTISTPAIKSDEIFNKLKWSDNVAEATLNKNDGDYKNNWTITLKITDFTKNVTVTDGTDVGTLVLNHIEKDETSVEEVDALNKGYLILKDRNLAYKKQEINGKTEGKTRQGFSQYDLNDDGIISEYDAAMIQTYLAGAYAEDTKDYEYISEYGNLNTDEKIDVNDATFIQKYARNHYEKVIKDDSITLHFEPRKALLTDTNKEIASITWTSLDESVATVVDNKDGTATIKAVGAIGAHTKILVKATTTDRETSGAIFSLEIDDFEVSMEKIKADGTSITEQDVVEMILNKTAEETAKLEITNIDTTGSDVVWSIEDESIATLTVDEEKNSVEIEPTKAGKTKILATIAESTYGIDLTVQTNVEKISIIHNGEIETENPLQLHLTEIYDFTIRTYPEVTSEECKVSIDNEDILALSESDGVYTLEAIQEGEASIVVEGELGTATFPVIVTANTNPTIESIKVLDTDKNYKAGDIVKIEVEFDQNIKGDIPEMKLYFGEEDALGTIEGTIEGNKLIYNYEVSEEDNGQLYVGNISLSEGEKLTDETGIAEVNLSKYKLYILESEEGAEGAEGAEGTEGAEGAEGTEGAEGAEGTEETEETEDVYAIDGIYIWQKTPTIETVVYTSGNSFAAKDGDTVYVSMISSKDLKGAPLVKIGGQEVEVTGEGKEYKANITISKDKIPEGLLSVEIAEFEDIYENVGEAIAVNTDEDAGDAVIIDYTAPEIDKVQSNYTKESKTGDKIQIKVTFADKTKGTTELIQVPVTEEDGKTIYQFPAMKLAFGGKEAKGTITAEFLAEETEDENSSEETIVEYSDTILYTYTLTDNDKGDISISSIAGKVYDMAGNQTELKYDNLKLEEDNGENNEGENNGGENNEGENNEGENSKGDNNTSQGKTEKDNQATGKLPYAGAAVVGTGMFSTIILLGGIVLIKRFVL